MSENSDTNIFGLKQEYYLYVLSAVTTLTAIALLSWFGWNYYTQRQLKKDKDKKGKINQREECKQRRVLDGFCVKDTKFKQNSKLIGVMVENHVESRPPLGLSEARVVYEAPVEGNISRFLAIYTESQDVDKVGPIRSARPYFVDWVREYGDMMYGHVGGSPSALEYIKKIDINDLDQFSKEWYFWRSKNRKQPHNVFISGKLWNNALDEYSDQYEDKEYKQWEFKPRESCNDISTSSQKSVSSSFYSKCQSQAEIVFSSPWHEVTWKYNTSSEKYIRYQGEDIHQDKSGDKITADTVIVQHVDTQIIDEVGRLNMETTGSGEVEILMNGGLIKGKWKKESRDSRTKFYDKEGNEIKLEPGKIWIEVVNQKTSVNL